MFSLKKLATKRIQKRFNAQVDKFEKKNGHKPLLKELENIQLISIPERIWFSLVGSGFLYLSVLSAENNVWLLALAMGPLSTYILYRGVIGRTLDTQKIALSDESGGVSLENEISEKTLRDHLESIENTHVYTLIMIDALLSALLVIVEVMAAVLGAIASAFG